MGTKYFKMRLVGKRILNIHFSFTVFLFNQPADCTSGRSNEFLLHKMVFA